MKIQILTLFPKMFTGPFDESIIKRAQDKGLVNLEIKDLRQWGQGERKTVDDRPYGGGVGMVIRVDVVANAISSLITNHKSPTTKIILLTPQGKVFNQKKALDLSKEKDIILICGHYEGFDERIRDLVDEELSIGDFVLTGGEIPAMAITDAVIRLIPGVLEKSEATKNESFSSLKIENSKIENLLEYPQYTRPEDFKGMTVPKILLSGNHKEIENWRKEKAQEKTKKNRPDLIK